ncbi:heterokaryon incompatibility protein-domain-containing protein [Cercophora newfieldiana]|uniref:Heterokaryon incompatibility protein-domain-containing protein n=1 Tax=Cercophora newfieldiana TaxID=92897 RepID=A0AA40CQ77_9PEZI|nr:heterokaryon incompatibility protein-domain-containing protein [Cercophora newfieldiana]
MSTISTNKIQHRPLDPSKHEIRVLSFENDTAAHGQLRLHLHHVSLDDWKPEYLSFRERNAPSTPVFGLSEAWSGRFEFTFRTPNTEVHDTITRFTWGDYICLSWKDWDGNGTEEQHPTIFVDGAAVRVSKMLAAALRDLRKSYECKVGLRVWVDTLCVDQEDVGERNAHVLRVREIFGTAFSVTVWTKEESDLWVTGLSEPGEMLLLCEIMMRMYGMRVLEELLGVRERDWGANETEDGEVMAMVQDVEVLVFDQVYWAGESDEEDELGVGKLHLRNLVAAELTGLFQKGYWSRLWAIQELAVSPTMSMVQWGEMILHLSTLQAVCELIFTRSHPQLLSVVLLWVQPKLDLIAFISTWRALGAASETEPPLSDEYLGMLKHLAETSTPSPARDKIYALLGLLPSSVSAAVTIDYAREASEAVGEFASAVPRWDQV